MEEEGEEEDVEGEREKEKQQIVCEMKEFVWYKAWKWLEQLPEIMW